MDMRLFHANLFGQSMGQVGQRRQPTASKLGGEA